MTRHIPYFDFYPADFMNGVRGLSPQEVGVYTMILCRIYEESGPIEFHLQRLATYCGMRPASFEKVVLKLVELGKFTLVDGSLSNRRAEAEIQSRADKLKINSKAGKASAEKKKENQSKEATDVQRPFNQAEADKINTLSSVSRAAPGDLSELQSKLVEAAGAQGIQPHGSIIVGPIVELISAGVSLELDILPTIKARAARLSRPAGSWAYFVPAIKDAFERRVSAGKSVPKPTDDLKGGTMMRQDGKVVPTTDARWRQRVERWSLSGSWEVADWGPAPGTAGCNVPAHVIASVAKEAA